MCRVLTPTYYVPSTSNAWWGVGDEVRGDPDTGAVRGLGDPGLRYGSVTVSALACLVPAILIVGVAGLSRLAGQQPTLHELVALLAASISVTFVAAAISRIHADAESHVNAITRENTEVADARVRAVARQFQWTIADNERLLQETRQARSVKMSALGRLGAANKRIEKLTALLLDAHARLAEMAPEVARDLEDEIEDLRERCVRLYWGLHDDGIIQWLQLEGGNWHTVPSRVRVRDAREHVIAVSYRSLASRLDDVTEEGFRRGLASLVFQVPDVVIADLHAGGPRAYRFEALVEDEWLPVRMIATGARSSTQGAAAHAYAKRDGAPAA